MVIEENGIHNSTELGIENELYDPGSDHDQSPRPPDKSQIRRTPGNPPYEAKKTFALAPLVDRIAYGFAKGLAAAVEELELHIASETRMLGNAVDRRFDTLQASFNEVAKFAEEQRSANIAVQDRLQQLTVDNVGVVETCARHTAELERLGTEARELSTSVSERIESTAASLRDADARQESQLETLSTEIKDCSSSTAQRINDLCGELSIHQEDIASLKEPIANVFTRLDALVERMDRQADAFRSMNATYSQRETELEQVMDGLARLRTYKTSLPATGL